MQPEKLRQRFEHAESTIAELARTCASHKDVPDALKQSIQQLDDQARQCHSRLEGAEDQLTFVEAIDKLEACSDRAKNGLPERQRQGGPFRGICRDARA